jgi:hypothetical protein
VPDDEDIILVLRPLPDCVPVGRPRLASLLKRLGRAYRLKVISIAWEPRGTHGTGQGERSAGGAGRESSG